MKYSFLNFRTKWLTRFQARRYECRTKSNSIVFPGREGSCGGFGQLQKSVQLLSVLVARIPPRSSLQLLRYINLRAPLLLSRNGHWAFPFLPIFLPFAFKPYWYLSEKILERESTVKGANLSERRMLTAFWDLTPCEIGTIACFTQCKQFLLDNDSTIKN